MGQCGCGDYQPDFKFKGPGDIIYVVQIYPSCYYCKTPAGVIIYAFSPEDQQDWDVDHLPEVEISDIGTCVGVINPSDLAQKLKTHLECDIEGCEVDYHSAFTDSVYKQIEDNKRLLRIKPQSR